MGGDGHRCVADESDSNAAGSMTVAAEHPITRKGREIRVRVLEMTGSDHEFGHILVFGELGPNPLVRLHSRCLYGDVLGSQDCDCRAELELSLDRIQAEGGGVLVYLEQEGRGAGLLVKAQGLRLSEESGVDTFTSYRMLGVDVDSRTYEHAAESLRTGLDLSAVRLMTNNPDKVTALRRVGLAVEIVPLNTRPSSERAKRYMEAKRLHAGHLLRGHNY
ncbi:GTP cyclohydrolase II RibA [Nocardia otitidiscaviarum]|nr:GTP cyclohydrolase II RibA [Nocardia otitidiscaviarum]MCP9618815.1 GTP cyclohydrolase II RibA [Nocardia otitidiscaviarum]